jgi:membrane-bound serine protease (ClpP class)
LLLLLWPSVAAAQGPRILELRLDGVVDPFESSYLTSEIDGAADEGFSSILLTIDTPGGLDSAMRDIVTSILNSEVPVVCYVSPSGARAASAGTFILTACHVAAMAPGTEVGAAHPVGISGVIQQDKVTNDAAAFIRSLAEQRDRNPEWAEEAVRESSSASAEEALELNAIDHLARSVSELLTAVDGEVVETPTGSVTLDTDDATLETRTLGPIASILHGLLTPDLAFILFYIGIGLIVIEFITPGLTVPGILGALSLVGAFTAFGMLAVQLVGLILLLASVVFFAVEVKLPGISGAGIGGLITLVLGGFMLFDNSIPSGGVSPWVIVPVAIGAGTFFAFVIPAGLRAQKLPPQMLAERVIGMEGVAATALRPGGVAQIASEQWSVESVAGNVREGARIRVVGGDGLTLQVEPVTDKSKTSSPVEPQRSSK